MRQVVAVNEEKVKQILALEESNRELLNQQQNIKKQLEEVLNQSRIDKIQIETEKEKASKAHNSILQLSAELKEKLKEFSVLEQSYHKLLHDKESAEKQLQNVLQQYNTHKHLQSRDSLLETDQYTEIPAHRNSCKGSTLRDSSNGSTSRNASKGSTHRDSSIGSTSRISSKETAYGC